MAMDNVTATRQILSGGGTRQRIEWVDALRALAMVFVIYGHQVPDFTGYFVFTSPIKLTLFFAITGYVFNGKAEIKTFFYKLLRQLVIPWLVLSIGPYVILTPIKGIPYLTTHVVNILIGKENWYMPACIIAEIIWYFILKIGKTWIAGGLSIVGFVAGIVLYQNRILDILMINRAVCALLFIFMGYLFRQYEEKIDGLKTITIPLVIGGTVIYIGLGIATLYLYPGQNLDVHLNRYYNYPICFAMIIIGLFVLFVIARKIGHFPKWVLLVGQNTLVIYLFHTFAVSVTAKVFQIVHLTVNTITNIFITAIACAVCTVLALIINRLVPELLGKKREKKGLTP